MRQLFNPESAAVIGVSESKRNLGRNILANLNHFGYEGKVYAIGPEAMNVMGYRVYPSISALPETPDVAIILTPAHLVPELISDCGKKGTRWAIIESGGFGELGTEGESMENRVVEISKEYGMRIVGPNCIGIVNAAIGFYTQFNRMPNPYKKGPVAVLAQSGGVGLPLAERLGVSGVGLSKLVTMGNKLDLDEVDYLSYFMEDPDTKIIYFYLEDFKRGNEFARLASKCSKPIVLHKSNNSPLSHTIAQSHTAALAVDDAIVDAICRESGILRVHSITDAITTIQGLMLPRLEDKNLAVVSRSGGLAVIAADCCAKSGFGLPHFSDDVIQVAQNASRSDVIRHGNPLDLGTISHLSLFVDVVDAILHQKNIDGVLVVQVSQMAAEIEATSKLARRLNELSTRLDKPVAIVLEVPFKERIRFLETLDFPFFFEPRDAIQALHSQFNYHRTKSAILRGSVERPTEDASPSIDNWFKDRASRSRSPLIHECFELLEAMGIATVPWKMATNIEEAFEAASNLGVPLALKAVSPTLVHKSDQGGVSLNVNDRDTLEKEFRKLTAISSDVLGVMVQKMIFASRELIIGARRDPSFGPIVLVGFGGIMVEVMRDVQMHTAPVDMREAVRMIQNLSGAKLLGPFRGMRAADVDSAASILVKVSWLMDAYPSIREVDLNPVSLKDTGKGTLALDARIILS